MVHVDVENGDTRMCRLQRLDRHRRAVDHAVPRDHVGRAVVSGRTAKRVCNAVALLYGLGCGVCRRGSPKGGLPAVLRKRSGGIAHVPACLADDMRGIGAFGIQRMHVRDHLWSRARKRLPFIPAGFEKGQQVLGMHPPEDFAGNRCRRRDGQSQTVQPRQQKAGTFGLFRVAGNLAQRQAEHRIVRLCLLSVITFHVSPASCCLPICSVTRSLATPM